MILLVCSILRWSEVILVKSAVKKLPNKSKVLDR